MSTAGIPTVVESVVDSKVQNGEMFTAHDVTLEVRQRGHRVGHVEVRDAVHDYYGRGGLGVSYSRSTISVPGGTPFLYHSLNDDPNSYNNIRGAAVPSASIAVPSVSADDEDEDDEEEEDEDVNQAVTIPTNLIGTLNGNGHTNAANGNTNGNGHKSQPNGLTSRPVDSRKTLSIPAAVVRNAGFAPGQKVFAANTPNIPNVVVVDALPTNATVYSKYTVDRNNRVRLTQSLLSKAGIGGSSYDLEQNGNQVVVKLH